MSNNEHIGRNKLKQMDSLYIQAKYLCDYKKPFASYDGLKNPIILNISNETINKIKRAV